MDMADSMTTTATWEPIAFIVGIALVMVLFAFQLWRVLHTGHVRWRVQKIHRHHRPVAYWFEVAACVVGLVLLAGLLFLYLGP
jgi:uncharacterized membrane protein YjfL (UPF0719 family)